MIVLFPPADEGILGAKLDRLSRTRYRPGHSWKEGRIPASQPISMPQLRNTTTNFKAGFEGRSWALLVPFWSRTGPSPTSDVGRIPGGPGGSQGHCEGASQSSNVARVVLAVQYI